MLRTVSHYIDIYRQFLAINLERAMAFRVHFILLNFLDLCFYGTTLLTIDFTFRQVGPIGSWTREHFLFFASFMLAVHQLHMAFVSESFWNFSTEVRTGLLDFTLLRPANPIFITFFRFIRIGSMPPVLLSWVLLVHFGLKVHLSLSAWIMLPFMVLLAFALIVAVEIVLMLSAFWLVDSLGMNFFRMQLQDISRWPDFVYEATFRRFFTFFLPVLLASTAPVRFLFDHRHWGEIILASIILAIFLVLIQIVWQQGTKRYESASS